LSVYTLHDPTKVSIVSPGKKKHKRLPRKKLVKKSKRGTSSQRYCIASLTSSEKEMAKRAATDRIEAEPGEIFLEHKRKVSNSIFF
jgi:hypothetical protein